MQQPFDLRTFSKALAAPALVPLTAAPTRNLKIGHTCITWGTFPRGAEANATLEPAIKDIASLGFDSFETFPEVLEYWDAKGALTDLIQKYKLPLRSGYIRTNLTDPAKRKDNIEQVTRLAKIIKKYGGTFAVLAPNGVKRDTYNFQEHKDNIIAALEESAMAVNDVGLGT